MKKCPYCDFNSHVREQVNFDAWERALLADLAYEARLQPGQKLSSIFFGGGTPSLMPPHIAQRLIETAIAHWPAEADTEITLEANPSSVEAARFADLASAGVNRLSLGLQSLDDDALQFLGRLHDAKEGLSAVEIAQKQFARVSVDLIYALPNQTPDLWTKELEQALSLGTTHMSLYQLTIEEGTRFASDVRKGIFTPADEDSGGDLYTLTQQIMHAARRPAYEISNHAAPGQESRHNLTYWRYGDYIGIGPGAHGRRLNYATQRHKKPENFLSAIERNNHGLQQETQLAPAEQVTESLLMGLRLAEGVDIENLSQRFGFKREDMIDMDAAARLAGHNLLHWQGERLIISPAGMPLLDGILPEIVKL